MAMPGGVEAIDDLKPAKRGCEKRPFRDIVGREGGREGGGYGRKGEAA